MDDWQFETLVAALLAGPRAPDIVDKFEFILAQIRERGGLQAIHARAGLKRKIDDASAAPKSV
jgi:hypothetical protein